MSVENVSLNNYIPINRKLFTHPFWMESRPFSRFEAWLDLIQLARFEITEANALIGGNPIKWVRGEYPVSLRLLAERWKWSKNKVDNFLKVLENDQMIVKRTAQGTSQTIIRLCNYDTYNSKKKNEGQKTGNGRDSRGTEEGQGRDNTNKDNKYKKEEESMPPAENYPEADKEKFLLFQQWILDNAPRVAKMNEPFSLKQFINLKQKLDSKQIRDLLLKMHNWEPLIKKSRCAYLTILNWSRRDLNSTNQQQKPQQTTRSYGIQVVL